MMEQFEDESGLVIFFSYLKSERSPNHGLINRNLCLSFFSLMNLFLIFFGLDHTIGFRDLFFSMLPTFVRRNHMYLKMILRVRTEP